MTQILTDHTTGHILLVVIGFLAAAWAAGFYATNGGEAA